jgi:hypothetical protein
LKFLCFGCRKFETENLLINFWIFCSNLNFLHYDWGIFCTKAFFLEYQNSPACKSISSYIGWKRKFWAIVWYKIYVHAISDSRDNDGHIQLNRPTHTLSTMAVTTTWNFNLSTRFSSIIMLLISRKRFYWNYQPLLITWQFPWLIRSRPIRNCLKFSAPCLTAHCRVEIQQLLLGWKICFKKNAFRHFVAQMMLFRPHIFTCVCILCNTNKMIRNILTVFSGEKLWKVETQWETEIFQKSFYISCTGFNGLYIDTNFQNFKWFIFPQGNLNSLHLLTLDNANTFFDGIVEEQLKWKILMLHLVL